MLNFTPCPILSVSRLYPKLTNFGICEPSLILGKRRSTLSEVMNLGLATIQGITKLTLRCLGVTNCGINIQNFRHSSLGLPAINLLTSFLPSPETKPRVFAIIGSRGV